jgi:hypothetical protein
MAEEKELDMVNRDPNSINEHIKVAWEDVIAEPDGAHSIDCVWSLAYKCFSGGLKICYMILTILFGVPYALYWGCLFACIAFQNIWIITPQVRIMSINCLTLNKILGMILTGVCAPCIETCALCFSKITVTQG